MEKTILILVLSNGDQILADVSVEEQQYTYMCRDVLQIHTRVDQSGQMNMGITPYMPYADPAGGLAVPSNSTMIAIPGIELLNHYREHFGLIITPPEQKIILS
jgi:hypothetical protein